MIDFNALRTNRGQNMAQAQKALEKTEGGSYEDPLIWKPTRSDKDISMNVIRFLPVGKTDMQNAADNEANGVTDRFTSVDLTPLVKLLRHNFKGVNGYLNSLSPSTFGQEDPIKEWSMPQWGVLKGKDKEDPIIKAQREKLKDFIASSEYYVNILIINDAQKPENNGKVMKYKFGEAVRKIIDTGSTPKFPTDPSFDPFCPWTGADLQLNLSYEKRPFKGKEVYVPKFESVKWSAPAPMGDDTFIEKIWGEAHPLMDYLDRSKFPTYDELKAKFCKVMKFDENFEPLLPGASLGSASQSFINQTPSAPASSTPAASAPTSTATNIAAAPVQPSGDSDLDELERMMRGE